MRKIALYGQSTLTASYTMFVLEYLLRYLDLCFWGDLLELAVREQEAYAVLTRIKRRKKEKEAAALVKEITSGVKPRPLTTESEEENEESVVLNRFDDCIFQGKSKPRKTKKQKRAVKALYHGRTQTVAPGKHDDDTKKKAKMPNTTESTRSQENKDQENQAQNTTTILNMDKEEFQKLQENDPTLESIQKLGSWLEKVQQQQIQENSSNKTG